MTTQEPAAYIQQLECALRALARLARADNPGTLAEAVSVYANGTPEEGAAVRAWEEAEPGAGERPMTRITERCWLCGVPTLPSCLQRDMCADCYRKNQEGQSPEWQETARHIERLARDPTWRPFAMTVTFPRRHGA